MINEGEGGALIEEWVELANGCVCCTVKHSLVQALEQLVQKKERLDHILLETTGLANPAPLASILWLDDQLESAVKLDSIITVVDAKNLRLQLDEHRESASFPEAFLQIAFADVVILNKVDLVSREGLGPALNVVDDLENEIRDINSLAMVIPTVRCQVDLCKILDRQAYDARRVAHFETLLKEDRSVSTPNHHDYNVRTLCICEHKEVDLSKVRLWLEDLLWESKYNMDIYRCKGVLNVHNSEELHILQSKPRSAPLSVCTTRLQRDTSTPGLHGHHILLLSQGTHLPPRGTTNVIQRTNNDRFKTRSDKRIPHLDEGPLPPWNGLAEYPQPDLENESQRKMGLKS
ncbi:hypothetical protein QJS10_CPB17g01974 [Acorus calamus]|uniref:CobW/HypB/UreG nucleotide-binding domain-containing protein n=1 Tax=Acorus calamus TaxID=4465 RepID=A0AAV9CV04_ACOCL|nr:hypothetical protein QJS10_CPB17g01974 [Acorus calamus]